MVLIQNRLRLDRQFIIPIITLPALLGTAAISSISLLIVTVLTLLILLSFPLFCKSKVPQTRFFFAWALTSIICLWAIFEITVPLLELLPEENLIFRICMFGSIACFYWVSHQLPMHTAARDLICIAFVGKKTSTVEHHWIMWAKLPRW